ncbi:hypothetical protein [Sphingomonas fuzhouensis]|uniref:hypothetical protein n=1 Tax=Sphingomonas fuzhouensis TaxID=3106033 RepID=UPI002AFFE657|nr:hypothetical protein [Sphingomonas sp. SGZ-02]
MIATMLVMVMAGLSGQGEDAPPSVDTIVAKTRRLTSVETRCVYDPNSTDVTVCGRRNADRFRIPFELPPEPGDPRHEGVMEERTRLLARSSALKAMSPFQVGTGHLGVTFDSNPRGGGPTLRKPAP